MPRTLFRPLIAALAVPMLLTSLACSGLFFDQSKYEGTRTHDVYGVALPQNFIDMNLPPPGVKVGMLSGTTSLTTYHQLKNVNEMFKIYGDHLRSEGWVEEPSTGVYSYGRRFTKGDDELQLDATQSYSAYGGGYGGYGGYGGGYGPTPSQMVVTHYKRVLVPPWDALNLDLEGAKIRASQQSLELSWAGFSGPDTGKIFNDLLRAFVLEGWKVESVSPSDTYANAAVTRGSARVDINIGSPAPGSVQLWYSGY